MLYFILALGIALGFQFWEGAYGFDLGMTGDEAAHFVNTLVVRDYLTKGFGGNPLTFAKNYYEHLPRVSIGHWPPFYYIVQALLVSLFDRSIQAIIFFQAVILAALSACVGAIAAKRYGLLAGGAASLAMLLSPTPLYLINAVMVDNFMALMVLLSTLAWARYAEGRKLSWAVAFALIAAATILTKGSGFALALLPLFYTALSRQWRLLIAGPTWLAAGIVIVLTLPWTVVTMRFVADGFNFQPGLAYSILAATRYGVGFPQMFGYSVLAAFLIGAIAIIRANWRSEQHGPADHLETALLASALSVLIFQLTAPADIMPRYLLPLIPPVLIVALRGVQACCDAWRISAKALIPALAWAVLALGVVQTFRIPHAGTHLMDRVAATIMASSDPNPLILVAAGPNGEGALIAEFAALDPNLRKYVVRGTKLLASGDFMGADYLPRYGTDAEVEAVIKRDRFGWVVIDLSAESVSLPHVSQVVRTAERLPNWQQSGLYRRNGQTVVLFRILGPLPSAADIQQVTSALGLDKKLNGD